MCDYIRNASVFHLLLTIEQWLEKWAEKGPIFHGSADGITHDEWKGREARAPILQLNLNVTTTSFTKNNDTFCTSVSGMYTVVPF
jgi:hypothetical protein